MLAILWTALAVIGGFFLFAGLCILVIPSAVQRLEARV